MRFESRNYRRLLLACSCAVAASTAQAGLFDAFSSQAKIPPLQEEKTAPEAVPAPKEGKKSVKEESPVPEEQIPDWFKDSERLASLLGGNALGKVSAPRVIRRMESPVPGLDALVIEAEVQPKSEKGEYEEPRKELFIIYVDKANRHLIAGLFIDMEKNRNVGLLLERQVKGEREDSPAKALDVMAMHGVLSSPPEEGREPIIVVIDLGHEKGRSALANVAQYHASLEKSARRRPLKIIPVSAGQNELATGAMAMALGYEQMKSGNGYAKLVEYANLGDKAPWLDKTRLRNEGLLKQVMGLGIFKLDDNSTQALLARVDTLPLVYSVRNGRAIPIPTPLSTTDWKAVLLPDEETKP